MTRAKKKLHQNDEPRHEDAPILVPIQSLPDEMLAEIFEASISMSKRKPYAVPFPCVIASVNRRWRALAISTPRLWNTIVFFCESPLYRLLGIVEPEFQLQNLTLWIERSAPYLLDITIIVQPDACNSNIRQAIDRIIPHVDRWRRLAIQDIPTSMVGHNVAPLRNASAPRLQYFELSARQDDPYPYLTRDHIFTGGATALTTARIVGLSQICTPPFVGLTSLHFGGACQKSASIRLTRRDLYDLLTASSSLENLALEALEILPPSSAGEGDIQMPSLRTLSLNFANCEDSFVNILTVLSMPILETLSLAHMNQHHTLTFETFSDTSTPRYTALKTLKLFRCNTFREPFNKPPESFFSTFSSITHLYLISTPNFILEPKDSHEISQVYWPNLKAVTISPDVLPAIIWSRKDRAHPISTVYVPRNSLTNETSWADIHDDVDVFEIDDACDSLQYFGGLDHITVEEQDDSSNEYNNEDYDEDYDDYDGYGYTRSNRHAFYEDNFGVDYDDDSVESEVLEYWAVCGSD